VGAGKPFNLLPKSHNIASVQVRGHFLHLFGGLRGIGRDRCLPELPRIFACLTNRGAHIGERGGDAVFLMGQLGRNLSACFVGNLAYFLLGLLGKLLYSMLLSIFIR
jgi:hypothetical protein